MRTCGFFATLRRLIEFQHNELIVLIDFIVLVKLVPAFERFWNRRDNVRGSLHDRILIPVLLRFLQDGSRPL